jgi:PAS domain S-box-containing protein
MAVIPRDVTLLASIVAGSEEAILAVDRDGTVLVCNDAAQRLLELPADHAVGRVLHDEPGGTAAERERLRATIERVFATGEVARYEQARTQRDGTELHLAMTISPVAEARAVSIVCRDVTREHRADADRARLEAILDSSPSIIVALDTRYHLTDLNGAARRILGLTDDDIGRFLGEIIDPRRTPETPERREELLSVLEGASATFDTFLRAPDGTERTIDFTLAPIRATDGTVVGISAIGRDVTGERRDEEQRRRLAAVVESARDPVIAARLDGTVLSWNRAAERAFGACAADALGRSLAEVLPPWLRDVEPALHERVARGEAAAGIEVTASAADGTRTHHAVSAFALRDERGWLGANAIMVRDVTESKALAEQLGQAQRLESLGRLAGGIAHDFNNLMAVITGYAGVLARDVRGESCVHAVEEVERAARRAAELTSQLLAFSRQRPATATTVDVGATVRGVRAMLERLLGADLELVVRTEGDIVPVVADRGQLEQVVVNLAINARDAMPDGGTLRITAETVHLDAADRTRHLGLAPGPHACITVADTGSGMAPEVLDNIFEPFFTTKEMGDGTGLGLASVHGTVTGAGGRVAVESTPGQGSTFRVLLPAAPAEAPAPSAPPEGPAPPIAGGTETVLLCEDEEPLRVLLVRMLERAGYTVAAAMDAAQALELADGLGGAYDALVTDVIMPGGSGLDLAGELARRDGTRPLLLISGFSAEAVDRRTGVPAGSAFLEKPFDAAELLAALRTLLD